VHFLPKPLCQVNILNSNKTLISHLTVTTSFLYNPLLAHGNSSQFSSFDAQ